ncbi:WXG100 family type VII secretion target [Sanguibacter antarcticus]|uniref:WXG100 family type VII secretion target n=1 Tax=Sanguibacter antarcticus TaxID=372484 RepID=A0A2A9E7K4_9MICO|nr:hypothetical protein [Sanguibacter antarcticus]PFG34626.1 hypothetical protein ATL42_2543 [Sanguibacter antarcticus]
MPIDTAVPGDPAAVRAVATWLRTTFALAVSGYTDNITSARTTAGADWDGNASWGFQNVMTTLATHGSDLDADAQTAATGLDTYATALETAQATMAAVRTAATLAGLVVVAEQIHAPGPAPVAPRGPVLVGATSSRAATPFDRPTVDLVAHEMKVAAYVKAEDDAVTVAAFRADAIAAIKTIPDATAVRWGLVSGTFVGTFRGIAYGVRVSTLKDRGTVLTNDVKVLESRYVNARTVQERAFQENLRASKASELRVLTEDLKQSPHSRTGRLWAGRLPIVGTAVTLAGVGWDVHEGKSVSTALVGAVVATGTGIAVTVVFASGPVVLVAIAATGTAIALGWTAEWFWEKTVSEDVRASIDDGFEWVADSAKATGSWIADGTSSAWGLVTS